ncbi:MAG: TIGR04282 family arsenosugar biosynthesis glycosyltransferase [Alteripontixanthobacter sp.]
MEPPCPATLAIFAKWPEAGKTKTRLNPAIGADGAVAVYRKLLMHTVEQARASGLGVELRISGAPPQRFYEWLGDGIAIVDQGEGDLGARMARVEAPALLIGSDAPEVTPELLQQAARALEDAPAVIGPADDGGYWLIGFREPAPFLFEQMEWSVDSVLPETLRRLAERGIEPAMLPVLTDIDTGEDLAKFPAFAPEAER